MRVDSIANGTTWLNRVIILASILCIVLITVLNPKDAHVDRYYWPSQSYFLCMTVYFFIPLFWIAFNSQMRYFVI